MKLKVGENGKITLPQVVLEFLNIKTNDEINIITDTSNNAVLLKKVLKGCVFCGGAGELTRINEHYICAGCAELVKNAETGGYLRISKK